MHFAWSLTIFIAVTSVLLRILQLWKISKPLRAYIDEENCSSFFLFIWSQRVDKWTIFHDILRHTFAHLVVTTNLKGPKAQEKYYQRRRSWVPKNGAWTTSRFCWTEKRGATMPGWLCRRRGTGIWRWWKQFFSKWIYEQRNEQLLLIKWVFTLNKMKN